MAAVTEATGVVMVKVRSFFYAIVACGLSPVVVAQTSFNPYVEISQTYTDNLTFSPSDGDEEFITSLQPSFSFNHATSNWAADVNYQLTALAFNDRSEFDQVFHQFDGRTTVEVLANLLSLGLETNYYQRVVIPEDRLPFSAIAAASGAAGNITDVFSGSFRPVLGRDNGGFSWSLQPVLGFIDYLDDVDAINPNRRQVDAKYENVVFEIGSSADKASGFLWRTRYSYQRTDFEDEINPEFEYERLGQTLGVAVGPSVNLLATYGIESDLFESSTEAGFEETFWEASMEWEPGSFMRMELGVGERFFGETFRFSLSREVKRLSLSATFSQEPTSFAIDHLANPRGNFNLGSDIAGGDAFGIFGQTFISELFQLSARLELVNGSFSVNLYDGIRDFTDTDAEAGSRQVGIRYNRSIGRKTDLEFFGQWIRLDVQETTDRFERARIRLAFNRELSRSLSANLSFQRTERFSDFPASEFEEHSVSLGLAWRRPERIQR